MKTWPSTAAAEPSKARVPMISARVTREAKAPPACAAILGVAC